MGDFGKALVKVIDEYHPDRIIIEPSGVGKLSDVIGAVKKVMNEDVTLGHTVAVVDAGKVKVYMKNFGEFYNNQVETASAIILSRTDSIPQAKLDAAVAMLREHNDKAAIVTTPWGQLTGAQLMDAMEGQSSLARELAKLEEEHHHHHDHDDDDDDCCCHDHEEHGHHHHDHDDDDDGCCHDHEEHEHHHHDHEHHHHDHDDDCCCHDHEEHEHHHHDHDENCTCGCHDHGHHHHDHHADEVFTSWGVETARKFDKSAVEAALKELDTGKYGAVLRAKGILPAADGSWIHFDYVPEEINVRTGGADITGKLCVIGSKLDEKGIAALFGV